MKKKLLALLLTAALALTILSGCGSKTESTSGSSAASPAPDSAPATVSTPETTPQEQEASAAEASIPEEEEEEEEDNRNEGRDRLEAAADAVGQEDREPFRAADVRQEFREPVDHHAADQNVEEVKFCVNRNITYMMKRKIGRPSQRLRTTRSILSVSVAEASPTRTIAFSAMLATRL